MRKLVQPNNSKINIAPKIKNRGISLYKKGKYGASHPIQSNKKIAGNSYGFGKQKAYDYKKKATDNISKARTIIVKEKGFKAAFNLKYWLLTFAQLGISNAFPILISIIAVGFALMCILYGTVSVCYLVYFFKTILCVLFNILMTIANTILFAFHGLSYLVLSGIVESINTMQYYFLSPLYEGINAISNFLTFGDIVSFSPLWEGETIPMQPSHCFSYMIPGPVVWGNWDSLTSGYLVKAGADPYIAGEYLKVAGQGGADLLFPKPNIGAMANSLWAENYANPGEVLVEFHAENFRTVGEDFAKVLAKLRERSLLDIIMSVASPVLPVVEPMANAATSAVDGIKTLLNILNNIKW